jgi:signal transduction histidine kinase
LRTPLAVIHTTAELALRRERTPESYRQSLRQITAETQRMTQLVEDLLFLARSDIASAQMPLAALDLRDIVKQVCQELEALAAERNIRLDIRLEEDPVVISGNAPALHRLFLVLLDNAVKYSPQGGQVSITLRGNGSVASVAIQDSGPGIGQADLPHIFERFYRADRARTTEGYGLGLSLAKSIAQAHNAEIHVESAANAGATFTVAFPLRSERTSGNLQFASV